MRTPEEVQRDRDELLAELAAARRALDTVSLTCRVYGVPTWSWDWVPFEDVVVEDLLSLSRLGLVKRVGGGWNGPLRWSLVSPLTRDTRPAPPAPRRAHASAAIDRAAPVRGATRLVGAR